MLLLFPGNIKSEHQKKGEFWALIHNLCVGKRSLYR